MKTVFLIVLLLLMTFCLFMGITTEDDYLSQQIVFDKRFEKQLNKLSSEERELYKQIIQTLVYKDPDTYKFSLIDGYYDEIEVRNIRFQLLHIENINFVDSFCRNLNYELLGISIIGKTDSVYLTPVKNQMKLYDLITEYLLWRIEMNLKEKAKDEEKIISDEHQKEVRKALKLLK